MKRLSLLLSLVVSSLLIGNSDTVTAATITFTPSTNSALRGQSFTVQIFGSSVNNIGGFSLYLNSTAPVNLFSITSYALNTTLFGYGGPGPTFPESISSTQASQDLGAFANSTLNANTSYLLGTATIAVSASATPGSYQIANTTNTVFADSTFSLNDPASRSFFTVAVVPEPSTWALGIAGVAFMTLMKVRRGNKRSEQAV